MCCVYIMPVYYKQLLLDWVDWNLTFEQTFAKYLSEQVWRRLTWPDCHHCKYWADNGEKTGKLSMNSLDELVLILNNKFYCVLEPHQGCWSRIYWIPFTFQRFRSHLGTYRKLMRLEKIAFNRLDIPRILAILIGFNEFHVLLYWPCTMGRNQLNIHP